MAPLFPTPTPTKTVRLELRGKCVRCLVWGNSVEGGWKRARSLGRAPNTLPEEAVSASAPVHRDGLIFLSVAR